jgi:NitT/TauT family transport system permease protein
MSLATASTTSRPHRLNAFRQATTRWGVVVLTFVILMIAWQGGVTIFNVPPFVLPAPSAIVVRFLQDVTSMSVWSDAAVTLVEVIAGFAVSAIFGLLVGSVVALNQLAEKIIYPYVLALQTIPKVALAPLLIIWAGFGIQSKIVMAALIAFFPIIVNVITGLKSAEGNRILLMRALKASPWQIFCKVRLPGMLPYYVAGLEIGIVFSMIGAIVGEFIGASKGLGMLIVMRQGSIDVTGVFSILIFLSLLGIALNLILKAVAAPYIAWSRELK